MVKDVGGKDISVKDKNTRGAKAVARDAVVPVGSNPSGSNKTQSNQSSKDYPHRRGDEIVLKRVLHEKHNPKEQDESADPCEKLNTEKCFPIDCHPRRKWS